MRNSGARFAERGGARQVPGAKLTVALDALAAAGLVAGSATDERALRDGTAAALSERFADWVLVDLVLGRAGRRSVAAGRPQPKVAAALAGLSARDCPLVMAAMSRRTPVVKTSLADPAELGLLPDGTSVLELLGARSYGVGPIASSGIAWGAISIVRCAPGPYVSFRDLGILSQIADLAGAAVARLAGRATERPGRGAASRRTG